MNLAAFAPQWLALILAVLLVAAAIEDAIQLRISNITVSLVLVGDIETDRAIDAATRAFGDWTGPPPAASSREIAATSCGQVR